MNNIITMRISINCPTVIYASTAIMLMREMALVNVMAPGSIFIFIYQKPTKIPDVIGLLFIYIYIPFTIRFNPCN